MLLPYLQVNAATIMHMREFFVCARKKLLQNINGGKEALNLWQQHFADLICVVWRWDCEGVRDDQIRRKL